MLSQANFELQENDYRHCLSNLGGKQIILEEL